MAWISSMGSAKKGLRNLGGSIFGGREDAGLLGTGQYKGGRTEVDEKAFTDNTASVARQKEMAKAMSQAQGRNAPQMSGAVIDQIQANQSRARQNALADSLSARVAGTGGPSLAEMQQRQGLNQSMANTMAQAASMRGVNPALALRMSQGSNAAAQQNAAFQGGMLRASEQQAAENQLAGLSTNMRSQDADMATQQARLKQETQLANQNAGLQNRQLNDAQVSQIRQQQLGLDESDRQSRQELARLRINEGLGIQNVNAGAYSDAANRRSNMAGSAAAGIAAMFASDRSLKTEINPAYLQTFQPSSKSGSSGSALGGGIASLLGSGGGGGGGGMLGGAAMGAMGMSDKGEKKGMNAASAKDFADSIKAYTYKYKEPEKWGQGQQLGVMAQDLEKTKAGQALVADTPEGKMVDYSKAGPILMATDAMLNERMNKMEKAMASRKRVA